MENTNPQEGLGEAIRKSNDINNVNVGETNESCSLSAAGNNGNNGNNNSEEEPCKEESALPCFNKPENANKEDFIAQLKEQAAAINNTEVSTLIENRNKVKKYGTRALRDPQAQLLARENWKEKKASEILEAISSKDKSDKDKEVIAECLKEKKYKDVEKIIEKIEAGNGIKITEAKKIAEAIVKVNNLQATHELDIVAGGNPSKISGLQNGTVNQSLGSQWKGSRVAALDKALACWEGKRNTPVIEITCCNCGDV